MEKDRFNGIIGNDYSLILNTVPGYNQLQKIIYKEIKKRFKNYNKKIIALEIGTGTGITTKKILESNSLIKLFSIDKSKIMIDQAPDYLLNYNFGDRINLINSGALEYLSKNDISKNKFDLFTSAFTLHNMDNEYRKKLLLKIYLNLKKGGFFINSDKYAVNNEDKFNVMLKNQLKKYKNYFPKIRRKDLMREWIKHEKEDALPNRKMIQNNSIQLMKKIGFKNIKIIYRNKMHATLIAEK